MKEESKETFFVFEVDEKEDKIESVPLFLSIDYSQAKRFASHDARMRDKCIGIYLIVFNANGIVTDVYIKERFKKEEKPQPAKIGQSVEGFMM